MRRARSRSSAAPSLPYTVSLNGGNSGATDRPSASELLRRDVTYGLYQDAARSLPWAARSVRIRRPGPAAVSRRRRPSTVVSRPDDAEPGTYTDSVIATVGY